MLRNVEKLEKSIDNVENVDYNIFTKTTIVYMITQSGRVVNRLTKKRKELTLLREVRNAGPNIKLRLEKMGIEQKVLAEVWGVTPAAVSNLLSGKRKLESDKLFTAADFLGCSVYDLIKPVVGAYILGEDNPKDSAGFMPQSLDAASGGGDLYE